MEQKLDDVVTEDIIEEEDAEENKEPEEWQKETDVIKGFPSEEQGLFIKREVFNILLQRIRERN